MEPHRPRQTPGETKAGTPPRGPEERKTPTRPVRRDDDDAASERKRLDEELDEALEETFPASDPPSLTEKPR